MQHAIEQENHALVRHRRVAHRRADSLETSGQQVVKRQVFVWCIPPIAAPDVAVEQFSRSLGQAVAQGLRKHTGIVVAVVEMLHPGADRRSENTETVFSVSLGRKIVRQTEIRLTLTGYTLLAQARNGKARAIFKAQDEVVAVAPSRIKADPAIRMKVSGKPREHTDSIVV